MSKSNLGWLYYKEMYKNGADDRHIKKIFNKLLEVNIKDYDTLDQEYSFKLKTIYPGLIIGSGYTIAINELY